MHSECLGAWLRLLLIEDEIRLGENIATALREAHFAVDHVCDGLAGSHLAEQDLFDAIILDLMLPGKTGQRVLSDLRRKKLNTPVLILTAQEGKSSIVELLNSGADDYLSKPFDLSELIARVRSLIRRSKGRSTSVLTAMDVRIDTVQGTVTVSGHAVDLYPLEYRILVYLTLRPGAIVSKQELLEHLYPMDWDHHSNVLEAHMSNLRKKLHSAGAQQLIETVRHRGYRLTQEMLDVE